MIPPTLTIACSDLFTLAGVERTMRPMTAKGHDGRPTIEFDATIIRDSALPAGIVEMRWSDGTTSRMRLKCEGVDP